MRTETIIAVPQLSRLAENLIGSEIIKIGGQLNARIAAWGEDRQPHHR